MWTRLQRELNCHAWAARDLCASDYCSGKQCRFIGASAQCGLATGGDETDWHGCAKSALECISDFAILLLPRKPSCRKKWRTDESGSFARNFSKSGSVWFFTFYNLLYSFAFLYSVVWRFVCMILICRFNKWTTTMVLRHVTTWPSEHFLFMDAIFLCCAKPLFGKNNSSGETYGWKNTVWNLFGDQAPFRSDDDTFLYLALSRNLTNDSLMYNYCLHFTCGYVWLTRW